LAVDLDTLLDAIAAHPFWGLAGLMAAAFLEYVFPPFPGDTVTLFGAFLVTARGWNGPLVFIAVTVGSILGVFINFIVGVWLFGKASIWRFTPGWRSRLVSKVDRGVEFFAERGEWTIVLNRFLPGIRSIFFVAAGMARMRLGWVLFFATLSAGAWNVLIFAAGAAVGENWDELRGMLTQYTQAIWLVLLALALAWRMKYMAGKLLKRRKNKQR